ncbi:MAG: NDP-sugar synthase [Chlorobiaceae bacterium]
MKAFVLAAGFGTRLSPLTDHTPKPLVPVCNIPCLFYTFSLLKQAGIRQIICNTHHHADAIKQFIESAELPGLEITFSEEPVILGTGGGLKKCEKLLSESDFLLVNSDIITDIDFAALIGHHRESGRPGTLTLFESPDAQDIGHIGVEDGVVKDFRNMRRTGLQSSFIYTGTAVLSPEIFKYLKPEFSGIVDTGFTGLVDNGGLGYYRHEGVWMDIGTMRNYHDANLDRSSVIAAMSGPMMRSIGMAPHQISPDAEISHESQIEHSVIGRGCRIGPRCTIRNSVILPGTEIQPGSTVIDAVIDPFHTIAL